MLFRTRRAGASLIITSVLLAGAVPLVGVPPVASAACVAPPVSDVAATPAGGAGFVPVAPQRLVDTRQGLGAPKAQVEAHCVLRVALDTANTPAGATAAVLTVTSAAAPRTTFLTVFACDSPRPYVSHLNPRRDDPVPGLAIVPLDTSRAACIYADDTTDVIVDVTGWYAPGGAPLHEITPARVLDTRTAPRPVGLAPGQPAAGTTVRIPLAGSVLSAAAKAVTAIVTVTGSTLPTYATAAPCGSSPGTSTVNTLPGVARGAPAMVGLDGTGALCVFTEQAADLIVDITGWFGDDATSTTLPLVVPGSPLREIQPKRLADSRNGTGGWTTRFASGEVRTLALLNTVAIGATAVQLEVIAVDALDAGYLTAYPCGSTAPTTSVVNFRPGGAPESSMVTVGLGSGGGVCISSFGRAHVVVDLIAVHGTSSGLRGFATDPGLDRLPVPGQPDHTVHCPVGGGPIHIAAVAAPGATISVGGGVDAKSVDTVQQMAVDGLLAIDTIGPAGSVRTWLRCLPNDFPHLSATGVSPTPTWYRASNLTPTNAPFAFIFDEYGVPVWYKRLPYASVGLFADGSTGVAWRKWSGQGFPLEPPPGPLERHALDGSLVSLVTLPGENVGWHEFLTLPNGHHLVVVYSYEDLAPADHRACRSAENGSAQQADKLINGHVVELDASGAEVWRWKSEDHVADTENLIPLCFDLDPGAPVVWGLDLLHINAVDVFPDGDLLVTARHLNALLRIDKATGAVEWKLGGNTPQEGTQLAIIEDPLNGPVAPHDGRVLPNGDVTIHDNRSGAQSPASRAVEYAISANSAKLVWSYRTPFASGTLGSVRRLADGSTVIAWGNATSPWLEQILPDGSHALTISVDTNTIYRAEPAVASFYDRTVLRANAGGTAASG